MNRGALYVALCLTGIVGVSMIPAGSTVQAQVSGGGSASGREVRYFAGERDAFHPQSRFESARKKRLTPTGYREIEPPVRTPDGRSVQRASLAAQNEKLSIQNFVSRDIVFPAYPFDYENDLEALERLARDHRLDTLKTSGPEEFDQLCVLMVYVNRFMTGGSIPDAQNDPGPSAEQITRFRRERGIGGTSRHYAALFCQLSLSLGYTARMVGMHSISEQGEVLTHDVCEVYLNDVACWAVFDPYSRATVYLRGGKPLSALDLHTLMLDGNYRSIEPRSFIGDFSDVASVRERLLPRYRYFYIWRMNDILSKSPRNGSISWADLYTTHLVWEDERTLVANGGFERVPAFAGGSKGVRFATHDRNDLYWPVNCVRLDVKVESNERFTFYLTTFTPNFESFVSRGDKDKTITGHIWQPASVLDFHVVVSKNRLGRTGSRSYLEASR